MRWSLLPCSIIADAALLRDDANSSIACSSGDARPESRRENEARWTIPSCDATLSTDHPLLCRLFDFDAMRRLADVATQLSDVAHSTKQQHGPPTRHCTTACCYRLFAAGRQSVDEAEEAALVCEILDRMKRLATVGAIPIARRVSRG